MKKNKIPPRKKFPNIRKTLRKQKRQEKKQHRQEHYLKKKTGLEKPQYTPGRFVKRPADALDADTEVKKKKQKLQPTAQDIVSRQREKERKEVNKLNSQMEEQRRKMLLHANEDEDKVIKKLEKQLGLNKSKNKNNYFADDGLDYLLEICDRTTTEQIVAAEKHLADVEDESDFEEDLAAVTGKEVTKKEKKNKKDGHKDTQNNDSNQGEKVKRKENVNKDKDTSNNDSDQESDDQSLSEEDSNFDDDLRQSDLSDDEAGDDSEDEASNYGDDGSDTEDHDASMSEDEIEKPAKSQKHTRKELSINSKNSGSKEKSKEKSDVKETKSSKERIISEDDLSKVFSDDEISHLSGDDDEEMSGDDYDIDDKKPDVWEDIYGRKRDKEGNIIKEEKGVYIPPHLRNKDSTSDKDLEQLKRQIKSVLNKLSGTNLHWAATSIENVYSRNSRHSVNSALAQLWMQATGVGGGSATPDRLVAEHACLVAVLHANVAMEIGAHFLQELSTKFDLLMQTPQPIEDKTLDNLVSCLAHLYGFKIFHATLLYDILNRLLEKLTEKNIDCVLVALRCVGGVLRKEEPMALKGFIHDTQARVAKLSDEAAKGSRIKFLLEVLLAVKNNNLTKIPGYEPTYCEELKKSMKGVIRKGNYITPLNIRLEDLLKAEERGKWWIVGSAWEGQRPPLEAKPAAVPAVDQKLLELARLQRMNTDVRRSIFCVIMSAEDYMDAFERLQRLGLRGQQEREIVHVLTACCLNEKTYNPYYAVLAQKLCDTDRKYQLSIQFSVWDKIKELDNLSKQNITNLAQFLIHLIVEKGLSLAVLKIIEFSDLNKKIVKFMRQILLAIIMNADLQSSLEVFHRIAKSPKLRMFRDSLRLFIQHFLIKNAGKKNEVLSDGEMTILRDRAMEVDKILTSNESRLQL